MNKSIRIIIIIIFITVINIIARIPKTVLPSYALTPTATPSATTKLTPTKKPTQIPEDTQIEKIKDLVASRVAELKLVDKRGILGYVKSTTSTQIILADLKNEELKVDVDELTKFESPSKDTFGISDIKKGDLLSVVGLYNKQTNRILARFAEIASNVPQNIEGVVLSKDSAEFTLNISTNEGKKKTVNIETSTKSFIYEDGTTTKSGFSKILPGERVIIVGFADKTSTDQINAARIIHFPGMKLSEELKKAAAASVKNPTP